MNTTVDAIVIGGGIAGLSVASELARDRQVTVLEMEAALAQHTTGRSAAAWIAGYGGPTVYPFANASRGWLESNGHGEADHDLLRERGMLVVAERAKDAHELADYVANGAEPVSVEGALGRFPALRPEIVSTAVWDPTVQDIDVMAAVHVFGRVLRSRGGSIQMASPARSIARRNGAWEVTTPADVLVAPLIVNAAGAWADTVAGLAGVPKLGLQPYRRTLCTFDTPAGMDGTGWPLLLDAAERFYMKPEGAGFMATPADEVPVEPGDARPLMDDVAMALDMVARFTTLETRSIRSSWAGLRTFAPDRSLVLGPDPAADGFAWSAGQGGFGIMTAPAAARAVVALIETRGLPDDVIAAGGRSAHVLPDRLRA